jgi:hypothetical protein
MVVIILFLLAFAAGAAAGAYSAASTFKGDDVNNAFGASGISRLSSDNRWS